MPGDLNTWPVPTPPSAMLTRVQGRAGQLRRQRRLLMAAAPASLALALLVFAAGVFGNDPTSRRVKTLPADERTPETVVERDPSQEGLRPDGGPRVVAELPRGSESSTGPGPSGRDPEGAGSGLSSVGGGDFGGLPVIGPLRKPEPPRIAFARGESLFSVRPDGTALTPIQTPLPAGYPDWSPDGNRVVFEVDIYEDEIESQMQIAVANADGSGYRQLTRLDVSATSPRWSPDGRHILFLADGGTRPVVQGQNQMVSQMLVHIMRVDGTILRTVGRDAGKANWSPDGTRIAYTCINASSELCIVSADGAGDAVIPNTQGMDAPAWSPDGSRLAAMQNGLLVTLRPDGTDLRVLQPGLRVWTQTWSPDGQWIAVRGQDRATGAAGIYAVKADGSEAVRVTTNAADAYPSFTRS